MNIDSDKIYFGKAEVTINNVSSQYENVSVIINHFLKDETESILDEKLKLRFMGHNIKIKNGNETLLEYSIEYKGEIKDE